jgi:hypothetical protein
MGKSEKAAERHVEPLLLRALAPVVGDRFKMPDGVEKEVVYVTEDGLVGWRDKWETGQGPVYFEDLLKWASIVRVWLGNGVTFVERKRP